MLPFVLSLSKLCPELDEGGRLELLLRKSYTIIGVSGNEELPIVSYNDIPNLLWFILTKD